MIYAFEGPNGAGKTTTIKEMIVRSEKPTMYIPNGPSETPLQDYMSQLLSALEASKNGLDVFIDRFNMGEQVYPQIVGREGLISDIEDELIVQIGASLGVHWIVLCPPVGDLAAGLESKGEVADKIVLTKERAGFMQQVVHHKKRWKNNVHMLNARQTVDTVIGFVQAVTS